MFLLVPIHCQVDFREIVFLNEEFDIELTNKKIETWSKISRNKELKVKILFPEKCNIQGFN